MSVNEDQQARRLRVMDEIYRQTGDSTRVRVDLSRLGTHLGLSDSEMGAAVGYLVGEGLIDTLGAAAGRATPFRATITHKGVKEMERSADSPKEPTEHFPPRSSVNITINGNMVGSAIQTDSAGASQSVTTGDIAIGIDTKEGIDAFLAEYEAKQGELAREQTVETLAEIAADVATIKAQMTSPKGKKHFIKESLASIRAALENGVGGVVTAGLLIALGQIHF